jgi:hypothetical protein
MAEKKARVMFTISEREKADFKIQLQYDSLTQVKFFRSIIEGYIGKDPDLMLYINKFKKQNSIQNNDQRRKVLTNIKKSNETSSKFALGDEEVDNIFDILEREHPDL